MIGYQEQQPAPEDQPQERVTELNEWFTPFENYDDIPYQPPTDMSGRPSTHEKSRSKSIDFELANVGKFYVNVWWDDELVEPELAEGEKYLLVLPTSEKLIGGSQMKTEQERMETRPMALTVGATNLERQKAESLESIEAELPSGLIVSNEIWYDYTIEDETKDNIFTSGGWKLDGESFDDLLVPDTASLMQKLRIGIVPK